jgi:hypothetical protein
MKKQSSFDKWFTKHVDIIMPIVIVVIIICFVAFVVWLVKYDSWYGEVSIEEYKEIMQNKNFVIEKSLDHKYPNLVKTIDEYLEDEILVGCEYDHIKEMIKEFNFQHEKKQILKE